MRRRVCVALVGMLLLFAGAAPADKKSNADKNYKQGLELLQNGDFDGAAKLFQKALETKRSAPVLFNLGQALAKLGRLSEAKARLSEARAEAEKNGPQVMVQLSNDALVALETRFPRLIVELPSGIKDADVQVDGKKIDLGAEGTKLEPGSHELSVAAPGYERYTETVKLGESQKLKVSPKLEPDLGGGTPTTPKKHEQTTEPTEKKPSMVGPLLLGGLGLAAFGGATYMFLKVKSTDNERKALWQDYKCPGPSCPNGEPDDAATLRRSAESKALIGNVLLGVGGACVIGAGLWYYVSSKGGKTEQARVIVVPTLGGAAIAGQL